MDRTQTPTASRSSCWCACTPGIYSATSITDTITAATTCTGSSMHA